MESEEQKRLREKIRKEIENKLREDDNRLFGCIESPTKTLFRKIADYLFS